jgi:hypothetical protein
MPFATPSIPLTLLVLFAGTAGAPASELAPLGLPALAASSPTTRAIDVRAERFDELRALLIEQQIRNRPDNPKRFTDRLLPPADAPQGRR